MILIPSYSPKLAEVVGFRLHWTITHYCGIYAVSIMTGNSRYHILPSIGRSSPSLSPGSAQETSLHAAIDGEKAHRNVANNGVDASLMSHNGRLQMTAAEAAVNVESESETESESSVSRGFPD